MTLIGKNVDQTVPITHLFNLLQDNISSGNGELGELTVLETECSELMTAIERTSKEVGGDPMNSSRYRHAKAVRSCVKELRQILSENHSCSMLPAPPLLDEKDHKVPS